MKILITILIIIIGIFSLQTMGYVSLKFWGVKYEDARREIFEHSKAYTHGTIRDLQNLRLEYSKSNDESHRQILADTILHRSAAFPLEKLPHDLRKFINNLSS